MLTCEWAVICDYAVVAQDGKVSAIGIFDELGGASFPLTHPELWFVARLRGEPNTTARLLLEIVRPDDETMHDLGGSVSVGPAGVHTIALRFVMLPFPEPGRYTFRLSADTRAIRTVSLRVQHVLPGMAAPPAPTAGTIH